ncbi:MAG TPA: serine hydrolase domain-containing protein [Stellaceae bacterium]|nr:serine hydrolase domain-containing protein [Stellaceae bacterium]
MPDTYPLPSADPASLGFAAAPLQQLDRLIRGHIEEGRYPGAQIALARHGKLALFRSYGNARTEPHAPATDDTLFLLFSQTKVLTSCAVWTLIEEGRLSLMDRIADHLPEFAARGKGEITVHQVMTHQGGFPSGDVSPASWTDHTRMRAEVCDFSLDWTPGTRLQYHPRAAHLTQAMIIEAVTGEDYRAVIRDRVLAPLGLGSDVFVGVPAELQGRCADTYGPEPRDNSAAFKAAGLPSGGGYATARGIAAFYQMLLGKGRLGDVRLLSPRLVAYVTRNHTGERGDDAMTGIPMHRGLGPHVRGDSERIRGLGTLAAPETFGHGGAGTSYSWADPTSGVSFSYLTNGVQPEPWHSMRLDRVANLVHAAID